MRAVFWLLVVIGLPGWVMAEVEDAEASNDKYNCAVWVGVHGSQAVRWELGGTAVHSDGLCYSSILAYLGGEGIGSTAAMGHPSCGDPGTPRWRAGSFWHVFAGCPTGYVCKTIEWQVHTSNACDATKIKSATMRRTTGGDGSCAEGEGINPLTGECVQCPAGQSDDGAGGCENLFEDDKNIGGCFGVGNPCNPANGNKSQLETDFSSPALSFTRHYNSLETQDIGLGVGWTSPFHKRLEIGTDLIVVRQENGRGEPWVESSGELRGDADSEISLQKNEVGFLLTGSAGGMEQYDPTGRLLFESTPSGKTTTYSYLSNGRLSAVESHFGHSLSFTYDGNGHVRTITDSEGQVYTYNYDEGGNLTDVLYPDGVQRSYHYEDEDFPNHLTGITDENGDRFATFAYDEQGRAISTEHAETDNAGPQERFFLDYQN